MEFYCTAWFGLWHTCTSGTLGRSGSYVGVKRKCPKVGLCDKAVREIGAGVGTGRHEGLWPLRDWPALTIQIAHCIKQPFVTAWGNRAAICGRLASTIRGIFHGQSP